MKSLGIVIPTWNSRPYLAGHLEALARWQDLASQIVVVDSHSQDGTVEFLKENLRHPNAAFLEHPPGLYQSWNFGVRQLTTDYAYIATTGDTITREGIQHLLELAETFQAGVVISKPVFVELNGKPAADIHWPIDDLIATRKISRPRLLTPLEIVLFTATHLDGTLLGSSASNLFRTEILQEFPFPTNFGKGGDGAWAAMHAIDVVWAATPEKISTFLLHPNAAAPAEARAWKMSERLDRLLSSAWNEGSGEINGLCDLEKTRIATLLQTASDWLEHKQQFDIARHQGWPWFLNPLAWRNRWLRNKCHRQCVQLRQEALARLSEAS